MGWEQFLGNQTAVDALRRMITAGRLPHSIALAGPRGVGKYTLATMLARAVSCEDDAARAAGGFCGRCWSCRAIAGLESYEDSPQFAEVLADRTRQSLDERRDNPLVLSTHPDVFVFPPDGKTRQISVHQVRRMAALAQYRPARGRQRVFILDGAERMDEVAANAMLKILEEPPAGTLLVLVTPGWFELLPTIRSRVIAFRMGPLPAGDVERLLEPAGWSEAEKRLAARLSEGSPGAALRLDLAQSRRLRGELLGLLRDGVQADSFTALFTRSQALAQSREQSLETLVGVLYGLLHDLLYLLAGHAAGAPKRPLRNIDLEKELSALAARVDWDWMTRAAERLDRLDSLVRRNINRQVALEWFAVSLRAGEASRPSR